MYKKGDKFVVEIDKVVVDEEEDVILYAIKGFNRICRRVCRGTDRWQENRQRARNKKNHREADSVGGTYESTFTL